VAAKFIKNALALLPGYKHVSNIFYRTPVEDFLFGYAYSRQGSGIQCYLYILPLYLRTEFLHLGFSIYLPNAEGYISITNALEKKFLGREGRYASLNDPGVASDMVHACLEFKANNFRYEESIDGFIQMLMERSRPGYDGSLGPLMVDPRVRLYSLAASLVLKGQRDLAKADLEMIFDKTALDKRMEMPTEFYTVDLRGSQEKWSKLELDAIQDESEKDVLLEDAKQLYGLLNNGVATAQEWLKEFEQKNKILFKIT